jgi:Icc-related predicted phosphoesterase
MRLVFISDTHNQTAFTVPDGDVLIHCGDFSMQGNAGEIRRFDEWLAKQSHQYKIVIAGNHELGFEDSPASARRLLKTPIYLQDSSTTIEGVKFYGSPWTPFFNSWAFNLMSGRTLALKWEMIPDDVDVLITHGPPFGILDRNPEGDHCGCVELYEAVERVKPKVHAFGHIHHSAGAERIGETLFVNACIVNEQYRVAHEPIVVDLFAKGAVIVE